jgi:hypothetical protein
MLVDFSIRRYLSNKSSRPSGPKYEKSYKDQMKLSPYLKQALIGLLLGDVYANRLKAHHNTRLSFDQSKDKHSDYLNYLYDLFEPFVGTKPTSTNRKPDKRTGLTYDSLIFKTLAFPCFNEFYELFYPNGTKIVPLNISEYLTGVSLAFWIMDDGGKTTYGDLLLHTNSYTLEEVELLVSVLNNKFNLVCRLSKRRPDQWAILIPKRELHKVRALVSAYVHSSMKYKISD